MYNNSPIAAYQAMRQALGGNHNAPHHGGFDAYIEDMANGRKPISDEFKAVVLAVVKEQTDDVMAQHGYTHHEQESYDKELHRKFKEKIEHLRDLAPTDALRAIASISRMSRQPSVKFCRCFHRNVPSARWLKRLA